MRLLPGELRVIALGRNIDDVRRAMLRSPVGSGAAVFRIASGRRAQNKEMRHDVRSGETNSGVVRIRQSGQLANLRMLGTGTLADTGKMVILPVDQGFEHGPARFAQIRPRTTALSL